MKRWGWIVVLVVLLGTVGTGLFLRTRNVDGVLNSGGPVASPEVPAPESPSLEPPHTAPHLSAEYAPPEVSTPGLRGLVDRRLTLDERVPANITSVIPEVKDANDLAVLVKLLSDPGEPDTVRHEVANLLRRSDYPGLETALVAVLENPAEKARFRGWAVQHLGGLFSSGQSKGDRQLLIERMHQLLSDRDIEVRREALLALVRQDDPEAMKAVTGLLQAKGEEAGPMRDLAIRCAQQKNMREEIPAIRGYVRDTNEIVRVAAIVALSQWGDEPSRAAFEEAAQSDSVRLQRCAKAALTRLDNQKQTP